MVLAATTRTRKRVHSGIETMPALAPSQSNSAAALGNSSAKHESPASSDSTVSLQNHLRDHSKRSRRLGCGTWKPTAQLLDQTAVISDLRISNNADDFGRRPPIGFSFIRRIGTNRRTFMWNETIVLRSFGWSRYVCKIAVGSREPN